MTCKAPLYIIPKNKTGKYHNNGMWVPCRKCVLCRMKIISEWSLRVMNELETNEYSGTFVTLTYADKTLSNCAGNEYVPQRLKINYENESVNPKHLELYWKRLRKNYTANKIKYISCGEYGETYGRPHYHAIIIGITNNALNKSILTQSWGYGNVHTENVCYETCKYVMDYMHKKNDVNIVRGRHEPFHRVSKGMGKDFAERNMGEIYEKGGIPTNNGRTVSIPRYYVKKLFADGEIAKIANEQRMKKYFSPNGIQDIDNIDDYYNMDVVARKRQRELNIETKAKMVRIRELE